MDNDDAKQVVPGGSLKDRLRAQQKTPSVPPSSQESTQQEIQQAAAPATASVQPAQPTPAPVVETPPEPLWKAKWSVAYRLLPHDKRYHKSAYEMQPHYLGALRAIGILRNNTKKFLLLEEMMSDFIEKHRALLEENEDLVRECEKEWRERFNL